jgi:hypothetical protein
MITLTTLFMVANSVQDATPDFSKKFDFVDDFVTRNGFLLTSTILLGIGIVGMVGAGIFVIIMSLIKKKVNPEIIAVPIMPLMIGMMFAIIGSTTPHEDITGRVEELQSWAEKRYVLNLTEEQAEKLIELSDNTKSEKSIEMGIN